MNRRIPKMLPMQEDIQRLRRNNVPRKSTQSQRLYVQVTTWMQSAEAKNKHYTHSSKYAQCANNQQLRTVVNL